MAGGELEILQHGVGDEVCCTVFVVGEARSFLCVAPVGIDYILINATVTY